MNEERGCGAWCAGDGRRRPPAIPAAIAGLVQAHADRLHPLPTELARNLLHILDALVDLGDRRSAALQLSESFRGVRLLPPA
jgi:hypothetical protein